MFNPLQPYTGLLSHAELSRWLESNYYRLERGGYAYLGDHINADSSDKWSSSSLKVLVVRLSTYNAVSLSMTHGLLSQIVHNHDPDCFVDFAFLPARTDMVKFEKAGLPLLFGVESKRHLSEFDLIFLSLPVTLERLNIPQCFVKSGLPLFSTQRMGDPSQPFVLYGGINAFCSEDLHGTYGEHRGLVDGVVIGDGEFAIKQVLDAHKETDSKAAFLEKCRGIKGFYDPSQFVPEYGVNPEYHPTFEMLKTLQPLEGQSPVVEREYVSDLDQYPVLTKNLIHHNGFSDTADIEVARGCGGRCSFCKESWANKPYRERDISKIKVQTEEALTNQGNVDINFWSFNWSDHTDTYGLIEYGMGRVPSLNLLSQRADVLAADPMQVEIMKLSGDTRVTTAIEGISQRIREYFHKNLSEQEILDAIQAMIGQDFHELKIFCIATGFETDEDVAEFVSLLEKIEKIRNRGGRTMLVRVSFMLLLSTAYTPLQFERAHRWFNRDSNSLDPIIQKCREYLIGFRLGLRLSEYPITQLMEQADRRVTAPLIDFASQEEYLYYSIVPKGVYESFGEHLKTHGLCYDQYFLEKPFSYTFPWDHIAMGPTKKGLHRLYLDAQKSKEGEYCLKTRARKFGCAGCKACPADYMDKFLINRELPEPKDLVKRVLLNRRSYEPAMFLRMSMRLTADKYRVIEPRALYQSLRRAFRMAGFPEECFIKVENDTRSLSRQGDEAFWTTGVFTTDVSLNNLSKHSPESMAKVLPEVNKYLPYFQIEEHTFIPIRNFRSLVEDPGLLQLEVIIPDLSLEETVRSNIALLKSGEVEMKRRVAQKRNTYSTEKSVIPKSMIFELFLDVSTDLKLRGVVSAKLNPYLLLAAATSKGVTKGLKYPIKVLRHLNSPPPSVGLMGLLSMVGSACTKCEQPRLTSFLTGDPTKYCYACDAGK